MARPSSISSKLADDVRRLIRDSFQPGEVLPSLRQLAGMYDVSHVSAHRALKQLATEGLVSFRKRKPCIRAHETAAPPRRPKLSGSPKPRIGIITSNSQSNCDNSSFHGILREEAASRKLETLWIPNTRNVRPNYLPATNRIDFEQVPWNAFDLGLLVQIDYPQCLVHPLLKRRAVLSVDDDFRSYGIPSVCHDNHFWGTFLARHLWAMGHRRFAVMEEDGPEGFPHDTAWTARRHGFEAELGLNGGRIDVAWRVGMLRNGMPLTPIREIVRAWFKAPPSRRPSALFTPHFGALLMPPLLDALDEIGIRIPRDLSLVGFYHDSFNLRSGPRAACVVGAQREMIRCALDAAETFFHESSRKRGAPSGEPRLFTVPMRFEPGETTAPPKGS